MKIFLNKCHYPVRTLGPGERIGIWMQGCSIGCPGCCSQDTWNPDTNSKIDIAEIIFWCEAQENADGVTISGGEPFEQPEALIALLEGLRNWEKRRNRALDILCYSGKTLRMLKAQHASILALLDALIPEPYVDKLSPIHPWRGSSNQPLLLLSDLGRRRFFNPTSKAEMQFDVNDDGLWIIGIPEDGHLERLRILAKARGVILESLSWRA